MIATVFIAISAIKRATISMVFFQDNKMPIGYLRSSTRPPSQRHVALVPPQLQPAGFGTAKTMISCD